MAFNTFASATSSIPLANLDANFTAIGTSDAASTLYPTATTSITYGGAATNHIFNTTGNNGFGVSSPTAAMHLRAGTATSPPLQLTSGTNLSTATAGAVEYDGTALYATGTIASGRGVVLTPSMVRINTTRTKATNNTNLEGIFDAANDSLALVANTLYYFRGIYNLTTSISTSARVLQIGFIFSNTQQDINYTAFVNPNGTTYNQTFGAVQSNTAGVTQVSTGGSTAAQLYSVLVEGWFKSNATTGGTLTPAFTQSVAGTTVAPTANAGTWLMIQPMGAVTSTVIAGNWT